MTAEHDDDVVVDLPDHHPDDVVDIPDQPPSHTSQKTQKTYASTDSNTEEKVALSTASIMFHIISIVCCLLSFFFPPFEIIPAVLVFLLIGEFTGKAYGVVLILSIIDLVITFIIGLIWFLIILSCGLFTFGICLIFLVFIIPYIIVFCGCLIGATGTTVGFLEQKNAHQ